MKPLLATATLIATLALAACAQQPAPYAIRDDGSRHVLADPSGAELLAYQYATYPAPEGASPAFARSGFIHPLRTKAGALLTKIQPADHYHHYGLWNPWTQTTFRGQTIDFWNLAKKQGTVRFAQLLASEATPDSATLSVLHHHVVFNPDQTETIALLEEQTIRVSSSTLPGAYLLDIESVYRCGTDDPITLLEYRYGGFGWRATEDWKQDNSSILTSEGLPRAQADGSLARWCIVQGVVDSVATGAVVMSHPDNYNHPEPLRIWPGPSNEGQIFFNFSPTKNRPWQLVPGQAYTQKYRMLIADFPLDAPTAETAWQTYAQTP